MLDASGLGTPAMAAITAVAGPVNTIAAAAARTHVARLYVVAMNPAP